MLDTIDSTASAINALNGNAYGSPSKVPLYMYTSLCTIWTGASGNVAALDKAIVVSSGEGKDPATNAITIAPYICESDSNENEGGLENDDTGAEAALVKIFLKTSPTPTSSVFNRIQNAELRIRLLLDTIIRSKYGYSSSIPINNTGDLSIDDTADLFMCQWLGYETEPSASQLAVNYALSYYRSFGKAILPNP